MGRVVAIGVLALLFAGCAGRVRPGEPGDSRDDGAVQVPVGLKGEVVETPGDEALPPVTRAELEPLPLPDGVAPADFDINLQYNGRVAYWLQYYQKYGDTFSGSLERMGRYEPYIRRELTSAGLPGDLIYLALIESGFVPAATSRAQAVGIWQFMAETARMEGLEISTYIDERRDPIRSTQAAVHHLRALYRELGSWYLVAAAYNSGSGRVARALDAAADGARGADSLFWRIDLTLPRETRDYVPQFIAASILAKYPDRFGLASDRRLPDDYETIKIDRPTDLAAVARAARTSEDAVRRLNPQFVRGVTPPGRTVAVRVPAGHADGVRTRLAAMPRRERVHNLRHTVDRDDTPQSIARAYGVSLSALRKANHLSRKTRHLAVGREVVIPLLPPVTLASADAKPSKKSAARKKVAASESADADPPAVASKGPVARKDADSASAPSGDSPSASGSKSGSDRLARGEAVETTAATARRTADEGRSPSAAKKRAASRDAGKAPASAKHRLAATTRSEGSKERIASADPAPEHPVHRTGASSRAGKEPASRRSATAAASSRAGKEPASRRSAAAAAGSTSGKRLVYRVRPGDTLSGIAHKHGVTVRELRAWNGMGSRDVLRAGDRVEIRPGG